MAELFSRLGFIFNGWDPKEDGFVVTEAPEIAAAERDIEYIQVNGRDGSLTVDNKRYNDIEIPFKLAFGCQEESFGEMYRFLKQKVNGSGELQFYDDDSFFRNVRFGKVISGIHEAMTAGTAEIAFRCDSYEYLVSGKTEITSGYSTLRNLYEIAKPLYRLYVEDGGQGQITVNGKTMTAQVPESGLYIDTELMIAYNVEDFSYANGLVSGKYEDLWLNPGENTITVTEGFTLGITPRWRTL